MDAVTESTGNHPKFHDKFLRNTISGIGNLLQSKDHG